MSAHQCDVFETGPYPFGQLQPDETDGQRQLPSFSTAVKYVTVAMRVANDGRAASSQCLPIPVLALDGADSPLGIHRGILPRHGSPQGLNGSGGDG